MALERENLADQPATINVLLVEDNPGDARLVQILLEEVETAVFEVTHVESLGESFGLLSESRFDVVLVDLSLPDSSGLDAVVRTRERAFGLPIVVLSGRDDEDTAMQALQGGAEDYLVKGQGGGEIIARSIRYSIQRKQSEQRLAYLEQYDGLTGLANRALLQDRLEQAVVRADRNETKLAVLSLSLDRFRAVNVEFGHDHGDALLQAVAERLAKYVHEGNTAARSGGDEFCLVVEDVSDTQAVVSLTTEILAAFRKPFSVKGKEISLSASLGIADYPSSERDRLLADAEFAMSRAKEEESNSYQFYTEDMNVEASARLDLERNLRRALERDEYVLYYQPQIDLSDGSIFGAEALLRWRHPERGIVPPFEFIPVLEDTGFIVEVGEWVLRTACLQTAEWAEDGFGPFRMAANLSARQFEGEGLAGVIDRSLDEAGLDPRCLELELTESLIMGDPEASRATLSSLKAEKGVRVSIDDFGTGYSNFIYLKQFPLDTLKIDKSLIREVVDNPNDAAIVTAIIGLAHALGLKVIAEGVETEEQLDFLRERGCDQVQGYLFSPPLPADEFIGLLKSIDSLPGFE